MSSLSVLLVGVGGQGAASAATLLAESALASGLHASVLETRGLAQRGGMVSAHARISARAGAATRSAPSAVRVIVALEPLEGLRAARMFPGTALLAIDKPMLPSRLPPSSYPRSSAILAELTELCERVLMLSTDSARPPSVFALGALLALGALPVHSAALSACVRAQLGALGESDLARGHKSVLTRGQGDSWAGLARGLQARESLEGRSS